MKYVIVGASAAGLACAEQIRKEDKTGEITVFTKEKHLPYSRPSISYYLKGVVKESGIYLRKSSVYKAERINIVTDTEVKLIDTASKTVKAGRSAYPYDKLCLCTGSKPFIPPMENVEGKTNALTFLDLETVGKVKALADKTTRAVVIGAGLIGMKAAEGLSKICRSVDVVEMSRRVLPSILDERASLLVKRHVEKEGHINFHLGDTVVGAKSKGKTITSVILRSGLELRCDLLILAVGVRPETSLAESAGIETDRGILTDPHTMVTSNGDIFAAGDCAVSVDMLDDRRKIIALWRNAVKQGRAAGSQMAGGDLTVDCAYAVNAIDFYGLRICTCGLINAEGERYTESITRKDDSYKRLIFEGERLVGFVLINSGENAGIYTSLIEKRINVKELDGRIEDRPTLFWFDPKSRLGRLRGES